MNKSEIIRGLARSSRQDFASVEATVNNFLDVIGLAIACGEDVKLSGFGVFEVREKRAVMRRNPKSGVEVHVPAKRALGFRASPALKQRINTDPTEPLEDDDEVHGSVEASAAERIPEPAPVLPDGAAVLGREQAESEVPGLR